MLSCSRTTANPTGCSETRPIHKGSMMIFWSSRSQRANNPQKCTRTSGGQSQQRQSGGAVIARDERSVSAVCTCCRCGGVCATGEIKTQTRAALNFSKQCGVKKPGLWSTPARSYRSMYSTVYRCTVARTVWPTDLRATLLHNFDLVCACCPDRHQPSFSETICGRQARHFRQILTAMACSRLVSRLALAKTSPLHSLRSITARNLHVTRVRTASVEAPVVAVTPPPPPPPRKPIGAFRGTSVNPARTTCRWP